MDDLTPTSAPPRTGRGYPLAVAVAGALLVCCAVLPWAGLQATSSLIGGSVTGDVRGVDDVYGVYTLVTGLAAVACGVSGLRGHPWLAALAAVPGGVAVLLLVLFVSEGGALQDRVSIHLGDLLSIEPVIRFGWFAALASAAAVVVLALLTLFHRRHR